MTSVNAVICDWREALKFADDWLAHEHEFLRELLQCLPVAVIDIGFTIDDDDDLVWTPLDKYWWWSLYFRSTKLTVRCEHNSTRFEDDKILITRNGSKCRTFTRGTHTPQSLADIVHHIDEKPSNPDPRD